MSWRSSHFVLPACDGGSQEFQDGMLDQTHDTIGLGAGVYSLYQRQVLAQVNCAGGWDMFSPCSEGRRLVHNIGDFLLKILHCDVGAGGKWLPFD